MKSQETTLPKLWCECSRKERDTVNTINKIIKRLKNDFVEDNCNLYQYELNRIDLLKFIDYVENYFD